MTESINSAMSIDYSSMIQSLSNVTKSSESDENLSAEQILQELQQDAMSSTMTAQEIADEYGITLSEAQTILNQLQEEGNEQGYTVDNPTPDGSTVSYHV